MVSMIADEADINRATFYAHFSNKEDFLEEMLYELLMGFEQAILDVFQGKRKINAAKLTPTTEVMFQYIEAHQQAFYALSKGHHDFDKRLEKLFHGLFTEKISLKQNHHYGN
ncbi:TetR/AcrR family transcriptional regulator [Oceanobacillus alkalisoli]|uniref:TetR/AcrR family transcriptional regulator n=2 Tax=Oceanobacillus alkalisoli TaxID=2925113 RepID=UPI001F12119D|nr:TetR/AcrR family transcriptional regulator [Oceanobacillus alkalisoli]MCF3945007.1 TetR/AcrR family transcriptional regulator [Oceanobacillus alkalisoli]